MDILERLQNALPDLPKKLALAARYALDHPDQIALNSMRTSANEVGVTSTTMLRLARQVGFDNYEDFKASFQSQLVSTGFGMRAGALRRDDPSDSHAPLPQRILEASRQNLDMTMSEKNLMALSDIARTIRQSPRCHLLGSGAAYWMAALMKSTGSMILPGLRVVAPEHPVAAEDIGLLEPEDVLVGFGVSPCAIRTIEGMKYAREQDVRTIAITDKIGSPLARYANHTLYSGTDSPHYYPSMGAMVVLVESLLATIVADGAGVEQERIKHIETQRKASGRYIEY